MNKDDDIFNSLKPFNVPTPDKFKKQTTIEIAKREFQKNIQNDTILEKKHSANYFSRLKHSFDMFLQSSWKMGTALASICVLVFVGFFSQDFLRFHNVSSPETQKIQQDVAIVTQVPSALPKTIEAESKLQEGRRLDTQYANAIAKPAPQNWMLSINKDEVISDNKVELEQNDTLGADVDFSNNEKAIFTDTSIAENNKNAEVTAAKSNFKYQRQKKFSGNIEANNLDSFIMLNTILTMTKTSLYAILFH